MPPVDRSGTGVLKVDGKVVATQKMAKTIPMTLQWDENFDVGADNNFKPFHTAIALFSESGKGNIFVPTI